MPDFITVIKERSTDSSPMGMSQSGTHGKIRAEWLKRNSWLATLAGQHRMENYQSFY